MSNSNNLEKTRESIVMTATLTATLGESLTTCRHMPHHNKYNSNNETENKNKSKNKYCNFLKSICNMKHIIKKSKENSNNTYKGIGKMSNSSNSFSSVTCSNIKCIPSLSLFHCSCLNSPRSIITNIASTIYYWIHNIQICWWWWFLKRRELQQQKQYKIKGTYLKNSFTASLALTLATISACKSSSTKANKQRKLKTMDFCTSIKFFYFLWLLLCIVVPCNSLSMTEVRIPKHIMRYETASLGCKYDLDGESLYSVKWYKDGFEFYRYVPRDNPPGQVFPLPGVDVDLQNSTDNVVVLNHVTLQSTGRYRCEVSGEAPSFQTVSGHEDMIVVVTPTKGPQITGGQPRYSIGEKVSVNCTSAPSKPICHLSWLINGVHANRSYLRYYEPKIVGREGLEVATLGLEFRVRG